MGGDPLAGLMLFLLAARVFDSLTSDVIFFVVYL
jgi:hypothetical protein